MATGNILKEMIVILWQKLLQYVDYEVPKFLNGQLDGFKARHHIKKYRPYGEPEIVDLVVVEKELQEIQEEVNPYRKQNLYNIDESVLFQKMTPDITLGTKQNARKKHKKTQITIYLSCNVSEFYKLKS